MEDAFEMTDALWAARNSDSSRVRRLTYVVLHGSKVLKGTYLQQLLVLSLIEDVNLPQ